jgi:hypothetical protein
MNIYHGFIPRIRHWHGHGIHSPFVYGLVRAVFTGGCRLGEQRDLYNIMRSKGLRRKMARQLQNLASHCGMWWEEGMCIVMPCDHVPTEPDGDTTFVVVAPYRNSDRINACMSASGGRLTVDTRRFFIIFNNRQLPHQHFKI